MDIGGGSESLPWFGRLLVRSASQPQRGAASGLVIAVVASVAACALDWRTGPDVSELVLYVALVGGLAWYFGAVVGVVAGVLGAASGAAVAGAHPDARIAAEAVVLNGLFRTSVLVAFALTVALLQRTLRALDRLTGVDPLTGLLNRRALFEATNRERARVARSGGAIAVAYIDLDGLKRINDTLGHEAGDALIASFAVSLRADLRTVDLVARLGGDEFVVVLPGTEADEAVHTLRRILERPEAPSASVGIVAWSGDVPDVETMVRSADALMYEAKSDGAGIRARTCGG